MVPALMAVFEDSTMSSKNGPQLFVFIGYSASHAVTSARARSCCAVSPRPNGFRLVEQPERAGPIRLCKRPDLRVRRLRRPVGVVPGTATVSDRRHPATTCAASVSARRAAAARYFVSPVTFASVTSSAPNEAALSGCRKPLPARMSPSNEPLCRIVLYGNGRCGHFALGDDSPCAR